MGEACQTIYFLEDNMFGIESRKRLKEDLAFYRKAYYESCEQTEELVQCINKLKASLQSKEDEINSLYHVKKENEIMKKYYKLDEEPSEEVQARIRGDLRIHDMEYKMMMDNLNQTRQALLLSRFNLML